MSPADPQAFVDDPSMVAPNLAVLRRSLACLRSELEGLAPQDHAARRPLSRVRRLGADLEELIELSQAPVLAPRPCRIDEIAFAGCLPLPRALRKRVQIACETRVPQALLDGPRIAQCLSRLLVNSFEAGASMALLYARCDADGLRFAVTDHGTRARFDPAQHCKPFHSSKPNHLGLGLHLVRRDIELMGGILELVPVHDGLRASLCLPRAQRSAGAAA